MKSLPTLEEFAIPMMENRFVIDSDTYPDWIDYSEDELLRISVGDGAYILTITELVRKDDANVFYVKMDHDNEEHTVQFLSNQAINPFE